MGLFIYEFSKVQSYDQCLVTTIARAYARPSHDGGLIHSTTLALGRGTNARLPRTRKRLSFRLG